MSEQKILIVEDEFLIARDLSKKLENMGYQVVDIVSSGQSALNAIAENPPDLIKSQEYQLSKYQSHRRF